jgi:hypothetical protein
MVLALVAACSKRTPGTCVNDGECGLGLYCKLDSPGKNTCAVRNDAGAGGSGGGAAPGDASDGPDTGDAGDGAGGRSGGCSTSGECGDGGARVCDVDAGVCVGCLTRADCAGATPACDTITKACVACLGSGSGGDCVGTTPVCEAKACRACRTDSECPADPGVCLADGHCATAGEAVFVEFKSAGCAGADGTSGGPFCTPNEGVAALTSARHVLVIRGAMSDRLVLSTIALRPVVVGKKNASDDPASVPATAGTAIQILSDDVVVRDLAVGNGSVSGSKGIVVSNPSTKARLSNVTVSLTNGLGVQADSGAELDMDRCAVLNNSVGGILINGASYQIQNSVVAGNGYGMKFTATAIPGAALAWFDTIVGSVGSAITCDPNNPQTLSDSIVAGLNDSCVLDDSATVAPAFASARPYHLTAPFPCPGVVGASFPDHDLDGSSRTAPPDCGADQFAPP